MKAPRVGSLVMVVWRDIETDPAWQTPEDAMEGGDFNTVETVGRYMGKRFGCHYVAPCSAWIEKDLIHRVSSVYKIPTGCVRGITEMKPPKMWLK